MLVAGGINAKNKTFSIRQRKYQITNIKIIGIWY